MKIYMSFVRKFNRFFLNLAEWCVTNSPYCIIGLLILSAAVKLLVHWLDPVVGRDAALYCHIAQCWFDEGSWDGSGPASSVAHPYLASAAVAQGCRSWLLHRPYD